MCPNCHTQTDNYRKRKTLEYYKKTKQKPPKPQQQYIKIKNCCVDCNTEISKTSKRCKSCAAKLQNVKNCKRPSIVILQQDVLDYQNNISAIGRKYGVSDNAVRKWIKYYNL